METESGMKRLCDLYLRRVEWIGALYCIVPTAVWFAGTFLLAPFRGVYVLRLILSLALGAPLAACANRFGLNLWLIKHRSPEGPATVFDGAAIGAAVGMATTLVPPLTSLIASNHGEQAKAFIIIAWLIALATGAALGGYLASIGRVHVDRGNAKQGERRA